MPARQNKQALFLRWLWLVYLPLGLLALGLPLVFFQVLTGAGVWVVGILSVYCVVPMRLLLETRRKGLELPKPPGAKARSRPPAPEHPAVAAAEAPAETVSTARVARPPVSAKIKRRRAVAGVLGIGVLLAIGGLLFILGMGKASSGQLGLLLIGLGGFLMLLSVTLPTFKIVDIMVRAIGRLVSKKGPPRSRATAE
ncbi:MAG TPA: hypothetical protein VHI31_01460 [Actinomycetota bacterium]|nr:hypothetical protein [Actinomycetota bacterium]